MIDLHNHSNNSDGTLTPEEIILEAKRKKLDLIALTDHNTLDGIDEFAKYANIHKQNAIAGVEISTIYNNTEIHLLGYFPINSNFYYPQYDKLRQINDNYKNGKRTQLEEIIENIGKDYKNISVKDFYNFLSTLPKSNNINRVHVANYLISKGIIFNVQEGFDLFLNDDSPYYVVKEQTKFLDAVKTIKDAGGLPVIAHLSQYNLSDKDIVGLFSNIKNITNEFGVEIFHYDHTKQDINRYRSLFNIVSGISNLDIFYTAGSDAHGTNKKNEIGVPYNFELDEDARKFLEDISKSFINRIKEKNMIKNKKDIGR